MIADLHFKRWLRVLGVADRVPTRQRSEWFAASDATLRSALAEADEAPDASERARRLDDILRAFVRASPPSDGPARRSIAEASHDSGIEESAALYVRSLLAESEAERRAILRSGGMPPALAERMRSLAAEGRIA